jgi:hypothetical protein
LTVAVSFAVLALTVLTARLLSRRQISVRRRSIVAAATTFFLAAIPLGFMAYGAITGWIRLVGRYGKLNDYSVAASPLGYWGTLIIYATVATIVLSWAFAYLRHDNAP